MCAICGIVNLDHNDPVDGAAIERMSETMLHRGPNDGGSFLDAATGLGFRRLSIIDIATGRQPMFNEDGSIAIVFNGEIYNYRDLASRLSANGHTFKTRCDTETIVHAYEEYGDDCVSHLRGMFAFGIWDRRRRRLLLARDRLGIKPLYYYHHRNFIAFASEIKALFEIGGIPSEVDAQALDQYVSLRYVPGPRTMFKNIFRLQPGHILVADETGVRLSKYWDINYTQTSRDSRNNLLDEFRELLEETVRLHLVSEVPLGLFLSGGLDSSAILAAMSGIAGGEGRIKTFSVGYDSSCAEDEQSNEFDYARLAADAFGAEHHECRLTAGDFQTYLADLVWHLDEPLADPACVPLYFVSRMAREHITVVLSGEGADEILAGYGIYGKMLAIDRINRGIQPLHRLMPWLELLAPSEKLRHYVRLSSQPLETRYRGVCRGFGLETGMKLMGEDWPARSETQLRQVFDGFFGAVRNASPLNRMLYVDTKIWLPDDLLLKADKMTMANGLELRVPFLDHKMVEFAAALPDHSKIQGGNTKSLLREAMRGVVPDRILDRPKKGFPVPVASWLRGPLRDFTRDHLLSPHSACAGYFDSKGVASIVKEHEQGRANRSQELWTLLVFEFWHRRFIRNSVQRSAA